jgi:hypothetical protein
MMKVRSVTVCFETSKDTDHTAAGSQIPPCEKLDDDWVVLTFCRVAPRTVND